jgi:hypothetical protein
MVRGFVPPAAVRPADRYAPCRTINRGVKNAIKRARKNILCFSLVYALILQILYKLRGAWYFRAGCSRLLITQMHKHLKILKEE